MKKKTKQVPVPVKEKNKFKDKFFAYLLAGCMIFWTIASVLGIVGFANSIDKEKAVESSTAVAVSADNVHQVREKKGASNRQVKDKQKSIAIDNQNVPEYIYELSAMNDIHFTMVEGANAFYTGCAFSNDFLIRHYGDNFSFIVQKGVRTSSNWEVYNFTNDVSSFSDITLYYFMVDDFLYYSGNRVHISFDSGFVPNSNEYYPYSYNISISRAGAYCQFKIVVDYISVLNADVTAKVSFIVVALNVSSQYDVFGLFGQHIVPIASYSPLIYNNRIEGISYATWFDSTAFDYGYNSGYAKGRLEGSNNSYNAGYTAGQSVGYNQGYAQGLLDNGGEWSFRSLLTAVIDTPVQVFTDLFNFEILGVNLTGFFLGLFSIALCLGVIKLIF